MAREHCYVNKSATTVDTSRFFAELGARLISSRICHPDALLPCPEAEVSDIERRAGVQLPGMYRGFLRTMGRGAGRLFSGTDMFYDPRIDFRALALEVLRREPRPIELPEPAAQCLVFAAHQGYQCWYLDLVERTSDPPVWHFIMDTEAPRPLGETFSKFLLAEVDGMEALLAKRPRLRA